MGGFWDESYRREPYGHPARVSLECKVPVWGLPIPPLDDAGDPVGPKSSPEMVSARTKMRPPWIQLRTGEGNFLATPPEVRDLLNPPPGMSQESLIEKAKARSAKREALTEKHKQTYEDMYGTTAKVYKGSSQLPPYMKGQEKIPTGILPLDLALGGGIVPGTRVNIAGSPDSGKSTLVDAIEGAHVNFYRSRVYDHYVETAGEHFDSQDELEEFARSQARDEKIAMIKPEGFELGYMTSAMNFQGPLEERLDVFDDNVEIVDTTFAEDSAQYAIEYFNSDTIDLSEDVGPEINSWMRPVSYRCYSFDSVDAMELAEERFKGKKMEEVAMGDDPRMAAQARVLSAFFRKGWQARKLPTTMILVSQYRAEMGGMGGARKSEHRGNAHPYFTDLEMKLWITNTARKEAQNEGKPIEVNCVFGKVHTEANVESGSHITFQLVPGKGYEVGANVLHALKEMGGGPLRVAGGGWTYYTPPATEENPDPEEINIGQGGDPASIEENLKSAGYELDLHNLYRRIMEDQGYGQHLPPTLPETL